MNPEPKTTPPARGGDGCFAKGCALFSGLMVLLAVALVAGSWWGLHYLRGYSSAEPVQLPIVEKSPAAPMAKPHSLPANPAIPMVNDWPSFQQAAQRGEAVGIELSAQEINRLIAESEARGKVFVSINDNIGRVQISLPIKGVPLIAGRHLNGELKVEASPDGDPKKVRISNVILNGQPVPDAFLDRSLFGYLSLRSTVEKWIEEQRIATFRIENDQAIGESRGRR